MKNRKYHTVGTVMICEEVLTTEAVDVLTLLIRVHLCKKSSLQFNFTQLVLTYLYLKYELSYYIFN
jgi:hypothetical protein